MKGFHPAALCSSVEFKLCPGPKAIKHPAISSSPATFFVVTKRIVPPTFAAAMTERNWRGMREGSFPTRCLPKGSSRVELVLEVP
jgi:hypothetical protein